MIFFYETIYKYLSHVPLLNIKIGFLITLIFTSLTIFIWITKKNLSHINSYLNILFFILSLTEAGIATYNYSLNLPFKHLTEEQEFTPNPDKNSATPVIYHILLDAYTSSSSLKKYWGYDNSRLENFLRSNGFYVADNAHSNSTATQQSMASTFNMEYQYNMDSILNNDLLSTSIYRNLINHSRISKELEARNYSIVNLSIFDIGDSVKFHRAGLLADATSFFRLLVDDTRFASIIKGPPYVDLNTNLAVFDSLQRLLKSIDTSKVFVYAHVNMPHDAYCDSLGNPFTADYKGNENKKYIESIAYTNKLLIETVKKILADSKTPPIIIIHGDHGSRMFDEPENYTILSAYYFPDKDYSMLYDSISPVNTYRVICNKYFKENLRLLPDKKEGRKFN